MKFIPLFAFSIVFMLSCKTKVPKLDKGVEVKNQYAKGYKIEDFENFKKLTVINPYQEGNSIKYAYYISENKDLLKEENIEIIEIPVKRVICLSTTHIGFLNLLEELESVVGISGKKYITNPKLVDEIKTGKLKDVGYESNLNYELIVKLNPDVVFAYGVSGSEASFIHKLKKLGIHVVIVGEYLEEHPLAKFEWIKFMSLFYKKATLANTSFDRGINSYNKLKITVKNIEQKPKIMLGFPYQGTWYISGGESYIAQLITDAGGDYLWKNLDYRESRPMSFENIFIKAIHADYWLNIGELKEKNEITNYDKRLEMLKSFKQGNLFSNNKLINRTGGNSYYENGVVEPDTVLADLIHILHPNLLKNHKLKYYKKIN